MLKRRGRTRVPLTSSQRTGEYTGADSSHWEGHAEGGLSAEASGADGEEPWEPMDMGGFPTGLDLVGVCFKTVRQDPEIMALHLMSVTFSISLLVVYLYLVLGGLDAATLTEALADPAIYFLLFPYVVISVAVGTFFRGAAMAVAMIRLRGGDPVARDGLVAAGRRAHLIIAWALVVSVVTLIIALFRRGSRRGGRILVEAANLAWNIATYFAVPVILFEGLGPFDAIERSTGIVMRTWRESLAGNFGIGVVMLLALLPGFMLGPIGAHFWGVTGGVALAFAYWTVVGAIFGAVESVLIAALYRLATTGERPAGFDGHYSPLGHAFDRIRRTEDAAAPRSVESVRDGNLMFVRR